MATLNVLYAALFLDQLAVGIIIPMLPYYMQAISDDPAFYGFIESSYGLLQLMSSPLVGRMSDRWGRRNMLLLSFLGCIFSWTLTPMASSFAMLFFARIPVCPPPAYVRMAHLPH
eukprot:TRINITY_DN11532_c0_g1_i1.p1 TRINITY_DN11532_c0_g1~~TRINITY_DN11532_c0_g1_i1.p1  ORF type:complete len:123 (+),score=21.16 TRINITY_DN11532_c0_g1_i1:25-369(+)